MPAHPTSSGKARGRLTHLIPRPLAGPARGLHGGLGAAANDHDVRPRRGRHERWPPVRLSTTVSKTRQFDAWW